MAPAMILSERLTQPELRSKVVESVCALVEREVASKRGLGGVAVKAGFSVVTAVKPGFIRDVVTSLLPDFAASLQPIYDECRDGSEAAQVDRFAKQVTSNPRRAAEALLGVTDRKIGGARPGVRKSYEKLRPNAREHVEAAVPGLIETLTPFLK
jgi:hypothetical protein